MYDATLRRVRVAIVGVEKQYYILYVFSFCVCVCVCVCVCARSLSYAACSADVPYSIVTCGLTGCIFQHYLTNGRIFGKQILDINFV